MRRVQLSATVSPLETMPQSYLVKTVDPIDGLAEQTEFSGLHAEMRAIEYAAARYGRVLQNQETKESDDV